jgi:hypothetical protein
MFNTTFNNISVISWRSVLLEEETGVPGENHRPVASHWQTYHITLYDCIEYTSPEWVLFKWGVHNIHNGENKLLYDDDDDYYDVCFVLFPLVKVDFYMVLAHWYKSQQEACHTTVTSNQRVIALTRVCCVLSTTYTSYS